MTIQLSADPDVPSLVYCDSHHGCNRWEGLADGNEIPFGWLTVLEVGYPDEIVQPLVFCSWDCLRRRANTVCG